MSHHALNLAVRDYLRSRLNMAQEMIEVSDGGSFGQPPASAGIDFISIWPAGSQNTALESLDEFYSTNITVSRRTDDVPEDRMGSEVWAKALDGFDAFVRQVIANVHMDPNGGTNPQYAILNAANALIKAEKGPQNGFVVPLSLKSSGVPLRKTMDWWWAEPDPDTGTGNNYFAGLAQTIQLGGAERIQVIENQT
jgi:hypothetical protein